MTRVLQIVIGLMAFTASPAQSQQNRIYNQYIGETIQGEEPANGWRTDSINYGYNKEVYRNPFYLWSSFQKSPIMDKDFRYFYYRDGYALDGYHTIREEGTYGVSVFHANFKRGMPHGRVAFMSEEGSLRIEGWAEEGEVVGEWILYHPYTMVYYRRTYKAGMSFPTEMTYFDEHGDTSYYVRYEMDRLYEVAKTYEEGELHVLKERIYDEDVPLRGDEALYRVTRFYPGGQVEATGRMVFRHAVFEKEVGEWTFYSMDGNVLEVKEYPE